MILQISKTTTHLWFYQGMEGFDLKKLVSSIIIWRYMQPWLLLQRDNHLHCTDLQALSDITNNFQITFLLLPGELQQFFPIAHQIKAITRLDIKLESQHGNQSLCYGIVFYIVIFTFILPFVILAIKVVFHPCCNRVEAS